MSERIQLEPWYESVREQLVRPEQALPVSLYFWRRWAPRLGPDSAALLLWIRASFARGLEPTEVRIPPQAEVAKAVGLGGPKAVRVALRRLEEAGFLVRRSAYRWDAERGQTVHEADRYLVATSDPIAPEDEPQAVLLAAERAASDLFPPKLSTGEECEGRQGLHTGQVVTSVRAERAYTLPAERPDLDQCEGRQGPHTSQPVAAGSVRAARAHRNVRSNVSTNVNVRSREVENDEASRVRALVEDLVAGLGDPGSRRYFRRLASIMPEDALRAAMSEARQAQQEGTLRRSAGAYFTDLAKRRAAELGLELGRRSPC